MGRVSEQLLEEAFIRPIRFALLLDDQFPILSHLLDDSRDENLDYVNSKKLFDFCRSNGWLCDVTNAPGIAEDLERKDHLQQTDLLILDFHLNPGDKGDSSSALRILQVLSCSNHFNLVVVYTDEDSSTVVRDIAYSLGAGNDANVNLELAQSVFDDLEDEHLKHIYGKLITPSMLDSFLSGKSFQPKLRFLRDFIKDKLKVVLRTEQDALISLLLSSHLGKNMTPAVLANRNVTHQVESSFGNNAGPIWVTQGNVFIVVVNKSEQADIILVRLQQALSAWDPTPLQVMMVHARAEIERAGGVYDATVLESSRRQAGWLLRVLSASGSARTRSISELYGRLFERLVASVGRKIEDFGSRAISLTPGEDPAKQAKLLAGADCSLSSTSVYHAMNEYLCSDNSPVEQITTGVIFRTSRSNQYAYWLCVSPACDLIPGQKLNGWDKELTPIRPISVARLSVIKKLERVTTVLNEATRGRHVFVYVDNDSIALEIIEDRSRQMKLEVILLKENGGIANQRFFGYIIGVPDVSGPVSNANAGEKVEQLGAELTVVPCLHETCFEVVAVLRPDYANRMLAESGNQRSRIGVDFVNLPAGTGAAEESCMGNKF